MNGLIFDIYRGTTHDGPGIRDTVFFKGCSLACKWCQNPESIEKTNKVLYHKNICIGCGECVSVCPSGAASVGQNGINFDYSLCLGCNSCADACKSGAFAPIARRITTEDVLKCVSKDKSFFDISGGGVTLSGGEPLLQGSFALELLRELKNRGISTALDTCAMVSEDVFMSALPYVDILLLDLKIFDSDEHKRFTGSHNKQILSNAIAAAAYVRKNSQHRIWVRTPIIPGATDKDENIRALADFIKNELSGAVEKWELCMFNRAAGEKYESMGKKWIYRNEPSVSIKARDHILKIASDGMDIEVLTSGITK